MIKKTCDRCSRNFYIQAKDKATPLDCPFCGRKLRVGVTGSGYDKKPCGCGS